MHCNSFLQPTDDISLDAYSNSCAPQLLPTIPLSFLPFLHFGNLAALIVLPRTETRIAQNTVQKRPNHFLVTMSSPAAQASELLKNAFPGRVTTPDSKDAFVVERERPWSVLVPDIEVIIFVAR